MRWSGEASCCSVHGKCDGARTRARSRAKDLALSDKTGLRPELGLRPSEGRSISIAAVNPATAVDCRSHLSQLPRRGDELKVDPTPSTTFAVITRGFSIERDYSSNSRCKVPRYYFDIHDRKGFHRDEFGDEFSNRDQAREQARGLLPDLVRDELPDGEFYTITCDVRDETGRVVYRGEVAFRGTQDPV